MLKKFFLNQAKQILLNSNIAKNKTIRENTENDKIKSQLKWKLKNSRGNKEIART